MKYTRLYSDEEGESHFEDVDLAMAPVDFAPPAPPLDLTSPMPAERLLFGKVQPGWAGDWHPAPARQFVLVLSGQLKAEVSDGETRTFDAGSVVLLEDITGRGHVTRSWADAETVVAFVQSS